jgi:ribosomal protein S27E
MIRFHLSAALVGVLIGCAPPTPTTSSPPVAKGTKITVKCYGLENFNIKFGDSREEVACRAKLLNACPSGYYLIEQTIEGLTQTFEITCH